MTSAQTRASDVRVFLCFVTGAQFALNNAFVINIMVRLLTVASLLVQWLFQVAYRQKMAATAYIVL